MSDRVVICTPGIYLQGTLANATPLVVALVHTNLPGTIWLNTVAAGKLIELSVDGGTLYFTPTYNTSNAGQLVVSITAPISHVRFTGVANDTWGVR